VVSYPAAMKKLQRSSGVKMPHGTSVALQSGNDEALHLCGTSHGGCLIDAGDGRSAAPDDWIAAHRALGPLPTVAEASEPA